MDRRRTGAQLLVRTEDEGAAQVPGGDVALYALRLPGVLCEGCSEGGLMSRAASSLSPGKCALCNGAMAEGMLRNLPLAANKVEWEEGKEATPIFRRGRKRHELVAWRCTKCGAVQLFAP